MEITIRDARVADGPAVHALACELAEAIGDGAPDFSAVEGRLGELISGERSRVLVAEAGGEVAGVVSLWIKPDLAHGDTVVEVPMLVVKKGWRRSGAGKFLMEEVRRVGLGAGASQIELVAARGNHAAREFYRSLGFTRADVVSLELSIS